MENDGEAGSTVCAVSVGVWKLQRQSFVFVYVCMCVCVCIHICVCSVKKKRDGIYIRHGACSPSDKIGCELC